MVNVKKREKIQVGFSLDESVLWDLEHYMRFTGETNRSEVVNRILKKVIPWAHKRMAETGIPY